MTPSQASFLRDTVLEIVRRQTRGTRKLIAAIPADQLAWRPHPKATATLELAWHIVESEVLLCELFSRGSWEGLAHADAPPASVAEVIAYHERLLPPGIEALRAIPGERLAADFEAFGRVQPLAEHLFFVPHHTLHHRGQLSAYLRAMGAFVPGVLGGSADERPPAA
jgi:uncharacterized damage-inducible protein DinB